MTDIPRPREADVRGCIEGLQKRADGRRAASLVTFEGKLVGHPDAEREAEFYELCVRTMRTLARIVWGQK